MSYDTPSPEVEEPAEPIVETGAPSQNPSQSDSDSQPGSDTQADSDPSREKEA